MLVFSYLALTFSIFWVFCNKVVCSYLFIFKVKENEGGRLFVVSGATGKVKGRCMDIPRNREIYISPIMHTTFDRSKYVIFGSGSIGDLGADGKKHVVREHKMRSYLTVFNILPV